MGRSQQDAAQEAGEYKKRSQMTQGHRDMAGPVYCPTFPLSLSFLIYQMEIINVKLLVFYFNYVYVHL